MSNTNNEEKLTFEFKGKKYLYDGILSFEPTLIEEGWIIVAIKNDIWRLPEECLTVVQRSDNVAIYVVSDRKNKIITDYIFENMSYLATRDGIDGKKWDVLIEA